jgi:hypothetical protein
LKVVFDGKTSPLAILMEYCKLKGPITPPKMVYQKCCTICDFQYGKEDIIKMHIL